MYNFQLLPAFADFIIQHHAGSFVSELVDQGYRMKAPVLEKLTQRYTHEQIIEISRESAIEFLRFLSSNKAGDQVRIAMERWLSDDMRVIGKYQIDAEDITLINYLRGRALKNHLRFYSTDFDTLFGIASEIDLLMLGSTTTAVENYMKILMSKIEEESDFSEKLMEASPAITFVLDLENKQEVFVSGKVAEVMGYSAAELIGMGSQMLTTLTHPDDLGSLMTHISKIVDRNTNELQQVEYRFLHKDGRYRWLRSYEVIFKRNADGKPTQLLGKIFEISQEKEVALALEKRERQLLEAQALAHIGSYEWNFMENTSTNTPEVYRIFEMQDEQKFEEFLSNVHPADVDHVQKSIAQAMATGVYQCEYRYIKNNREKVIWSLGKVEYAGEKPYVMNGTVQDVTEIKRLERELLLKTAELETLNGSLQQFAHIASHDLKEPIRKIAVFADKILGAEQDRLKPSSVASLKRMQHASGTMLKMVEDILAFSLLKQAEEKQRYPLEKVLADVTELLDQSIQEKQAVIVHNGLPEAIIIPSQFRQLFQNLISNSLKFAKKDTPPVITVTTAWVDTPPNGLEPANRQLQIEFQDNGIGFSNEWREQIFQLFQRLHSRAEFEGSGLGLSISQRIMENHGGTITADSEPGQGACFRITFPQ